MILYRLLNLFFDLLYHPLAPFYDGVAALVSLGRWQQWVLAVLPYLHGQVLELGSGPGHLQVALHQRGARPVAIDQSRQMIALSTRVLRRSGINAAKITRARANGLPFAAGSFDTIVSTFPSPYIRAADTLSEVRRVLRPDGCLVVLLAAWVTGPSLPERALATLLQTTGESPVMDAHYRAQVVAPYQAAGFAVELIFHEQDRSRLLILSAKLR